MNWHYFFEVIGMIVSIIAIMLLALYVTGVVHIETGRTTEEDTKPQ